ncbi:DNA-binding protein [Staphylococcus sp. NRL 16/872]|uniref:DNA-binding protein n=1 Tax=Staphylococcus sp. NRL 16/872 TaxID=2930131 RepID=UPI001FB1FD32|nr:MULTISPECIES: DNA-binding protein [unclassified Staphylococcus]MCJ1655385.1 DNA-binding protein [Staphylococcus sp. NRL 21/187]MCJ1661221.1 DNA-binding protein [Staphylococcus sp. NRL 18/288]MCJ1667110.1 DNA-binding protein [Staphylococcus sp. NRL 19/737]WEN69592.1 DNA-binding protein [Staphylococcus sp. NRL 16/872]
MKLIKVLSSTLLASTISITGLNVSHAAQNNDTNNSQTVLFDASHAQTAGAADWVMDGGFSDYADSMRQQGYSVKEIDGEANINEETLSNSKILVLPEANIPFKKKEQQAMIKYVKKGGNIIFIADHYNADRNLNRLDSSEVMNGYRRGAYADMTKDMTADEKNSQAMQGIKSSDWLSDNFGIRFRYNALGDLNTQNIVPSSESFGITKGIRSVSMHAGSTLAITDPTKAKGIIYTPEHLSSKQKWSHAVDQGIYNGGGVAEGPYVAIAKVGKGKAAFIGDSSLVEDSTPKYKREDNGQTKKTYDGFKEEDNGQLLTNITDWFGKVDHATSLKKSGIKLDQPTPTLAFETPQNSTEPQKEPWSQPEQGYKWYDRTTFAPGSYGTTKTTNSQNNNGSQKENGTNTPTHTTAGNVQFHLPDNIQLNKPFQITVNLSNMEQSKTLNQLKLSIYQDGGTQLASFTQDGKNYDNLGYSQPQSVTTDNEGNATLTFTAKVNTNISGANIRLKQGDKTLATGTIQ